MSGKLLVRACNLLPPSPASRAQVIKYGVVGADVLLRDLHAWDTLYIAGRLHKPVLHLIRDAELAAAAEANLAAALAAGLLLLPGRFSTEARSLSAPVSSWGSVWQYTPLTTKISCESRGSTNPTPGCIGVVVSLGWYGCCAG